MQINNMRNWGPSNNLSHTRLYMYMPIYTHVYIYYWRIDVKDLNIKIENEEVGEVGEVVDKSKSTRY